MSVTRKIGKKAARKKQSRVSPLDEPAAIDEFLRYQAGATRPGTTAVKDRIIGIPLGYEAEMLARFLRDCGARLEEALADYRHRAALDERQIVRGRYAKKVPMWALDMAVAILEQIPERPLRKPGKPKQEAVKMVERIAARMISVAAAARAVARGEAHQRGGGASEDKIEKRAADLARQVHRRRKTDMP